MGGKLKLRTKLLLYFYLMIGVAQCLPLPRDIGSKSIDDYWAETGIAGRDLEKFLVPESCNNNQLSYMACVNALMQMGDRYGLTLTPEGSFRQFTQNEILDKKSEKQNVANWMKAFESSFKEDKIDFLSAWIYLKTFHIPDKEISSTMSIGINSYLSIAMDPHTYIIPMSFYENVIAKNESRQFSIGAIIKRENDMWIAKKVHQDSPAYIAGLKKGDVIFELNNRSIKEYTQQKIVEILKSGMSNRLSFTVLRRPKELSSYSRNEIHHVEIYKMFRSYSSVTSEMLTHAGHRTGLVSVAKFAKGICQQIKGKIQELDNQKAEQLILDLRDNPGGQIEEASCIINMFVAKGTKMFETRYLAKHYMPDSYVAKEDPIYNKRLFILVNQGSASASEIVAGSLQDLGRAIILGEKTFGKGSFQDGQVWSTNDNIAFFQTQGLYFFPSGQTTQIVGVEPDIQIRQSLSNENTEREIYFNPLKEGDLSLRGFTRKPLIRNAIKLSGLNRNCLLNVERSYPKSEDQEMQKAQMFTECFDQDEPAGYSNSTAANPP